MSAFDRAGIPRGTITIGGRRVATWVADLLPGVTPTVEVAKRWLIVRSRVFHVRRRYEARLERMMKKLEADLTHHPIACSSRQK